MDPLQVGFWILRGSGPEQREAGGCLRQIPASKEGVQNVERTWRRYVRHPELNQKLKYRSKIST